VVANRARHAKLGGGRQTILDGLPTPTDGHARCVRSEVDRRSVTVTSSQAVSAVTSKRAKQRSKRTIFASKGRTAAKARGQLPTRGDSHGTSAQTTPSLLQEDAQLRRSPDPSPLARRIPGALGTFGGVRCQQLVNYNRVSEGLAQHRMQGGRVSVAYGSLRLPWRCR
jgi:hypothetical protein